MTTALRTLFQTIVHVALAAGMIAVSGCTPTAGPDIATATYGISSATAQSLATTNNESTPDQAPGVLVGAGNVAQNTLEAADVSQGFAPGAAPPSAVLPQALAKATALNSGVGAVANSGDYVTDGVVKTIAQAAPLTPADIAGQVPLSTAPAKVPSTQTASIEDSEPAAATAIADPIVTPKSAKPTLFGNIFGNKPRKAQQILTASPDAAETVQLASLETANENPARQTETMNSLPGVNAKNLFALDPSLKDNGDDGYEEEPPIEVASATAAGLARLAPNGLLKQTDRVDVACFKPELVAVLKKIEGHYGKKVVVTSGYRSPSGNRRAGGSRHSLHMMCAAADIQISGVGKWELAKYMRSMPGRGGVGTYCYTDSVHIDVGSERDWNWRCRRR